MSKIMRDIMSKEDKKDLIWDDSRGRYLHPKEQKILDDIDRLEGEIAISKMDVRDAYKALNILNSMKEK